MIIEIVLILNDPSKTEAFFCKTCPFLFFTRHGTQFRASEGAPPNPLCNCTLLYIFYQILKLAVMATT